MKLSFGFIQEITTVNRVWLVIVLLASMSILSVHESEARAPGVGIDPESRNVCGADPLGLPAGWKKPEKWAWTEICEGRDVDFNKQLKESIDPREPKDPEDWVDANRTLTPEFLETILLREPFRSTIPIRGVRIVGAYFPTSINLSHSVLGRPVIFRDCIFLAPVSMEWLRTPYTLAFSGSRFYGWTYLKNAVIGGDLLLRNAAVQDTFLNGAKIDGRVDMGSARLDGYFIANGATIEGDLSVQRAVFFHAFMDGLIVGGEFQMQGAKFRGDVSLDAASIAGSLSLNKATFQNAARFSFVNVGSHLDARGSTMWSLDLTGATIRRGLLLGSSDSSVKWRPCDEGRSRCPNMSLRDATVYLLQDTLATWPEHLQLELEGLSFSRFGGVEGSQEEAPYERGSKWFIRWLEMDATYSPQPYRFIARILVSAGYGDMAGEILFASRERERTEAELTQPKWWVLSAFRIIMGYGQGWRYLLTLFWMVLLVIVGTAVVASSGERGKDGRFLGFWYSLDMLLPIIHLREQHYDVDLDPPARYYFFVHKILGYVLVFILVAGLTGLLSDVTG